METQVSTDVALEFGLFGRLNGTVEFFQDLQTCYSMLANRYPVVSKDRTKHW